MVLLAVGILLATVAFVLYAHFSTKWQTTSRGPVSAGANPEFTVTDSADDKLSHGGKAKSKDIISSTEEKRAFATTPTFKMESEEEDATTPKAVPTMNVPSMAVPELSLSSNTAEKRDTVEGMQATAPTKPAAPVLSPSALMPPPSVRPSALRPLPKANGSSLMPPPSAASALRVPPGRAAPNGIAQNARNPSAATTSTLPAASRPRKKIILPPGHSPLDWAHLTRNPPSGTFLRGEGIPPRMLKISPTQLKHYTGRKGKDAWGTYQGKVYNLSPYKNFHPGGVPELMRGAGRPGEAERLFNEIHPWVNWDGMLGECLVGVLVGEGEGEGEKGDTGQTDLDEMD